MLPPRDASEITDVSSHIDRLCNEIASLQAVLEGSSTREEALNAQRLVGHLRTTTLINGLDLRQTKLKRLTSWAGALANPIAPSILQA